MNLLTVMGGAALLQLNPAGQAWSNTAETSSGLLVSKVRGETSTCLATTAPRKATVITDTRQRMCLISSVQLTIFIRLPMLEVPAHAVVQTVLRLIMFLRICRRLSRSFQVYLGPSCVDFYKHTRTRLLCNCWDSMKDGVELQIYLALFCQAMSRCTENDAQRSHALL